MNGQDGMGDAFIRDECVTSMFHMIAMRHIAGWKRVVDNRARMRLVPHSRRNAGVLAFAPRQAASLDPLLITLQRAARTTPLGGMLRTGLTGA